MHRSPLRSSPPTAAPATSAASHPRFRITSAAIEIAITALVAACGAPTAPAPTAPAPATPAPAPAPAASTAAAPELYGAGLFSTGGWDFFMAFSPDQRRVLFCRADDAFERYDILETRLTAAGTWSPPTKPRFAAAWSNADPHISPDGARVYFISNRPNPGETAARATYDIWAAALGADGEWGDAEHVPVGEPTVDEWSPAVAANGDLYFGSERPGGRGETDLWVARRVGGAYQPAENLGDAINTAGAEVEPWIAPDGSYLIFSALHRPESLGSYDLYLSRRTAAGGWAPARRLAAPINSPGREFTHSVSPDGRWLYFSSVRPLAGPIGPRFDTPRDDAAIQGIGNNKSGDIYRVPMSALGL